MKCYWTVNSSYWPPLRVSQYEVNTSWPPQQKSVVLQYWKPKINSFSYAEKKLWRMCTNFWINPHNGKLPSRLAPAQCQNSLTPQLLSNIYWSKTKTSISLNRVYWYDTMCHIFSCFIINVPFYCKTHCFWEKEWFKKNDELTKPTSLTSVHQHLVNNAKNLGCFSLTKLRLRKENKCLITLWRTWPLKLVQRNAPWQQDNNDVILGL